MVSVRLYLFRVSSFVSCREKTLDIGERIIAIYQQWPYFSRLILYLVGNLSSFWDDDPGVLSEGSLSSRNLFEGFILSKIAFLEILFKRPKSHFLLKFYYLPFWNDGWVDSKRFTLFCPCPLHRIWSRKREKKIWLSRVEQLPSKLLDSLQIWNGNIGLSGQSINSCNKLELFSLQILFSFCRPFSNITFGRIRV